MDAVTTAAAALAIAVAASEPFAMEALLLERERLAMTVEDQASFLAQRHWVGTLQVWQPRPMTWQAAFDQRHDDLLEAHAAMRVAANALRAGDVETALSRLEAEVGESDSEDEELSEAAMEEEEEEEDMDDDAEVAEVE